jgi:outer membrane lipopolysaccharide assembly protein LptE/RlpB
MRGLVAFATSCAALCLAGCGYHVAGKADLLPTTLHTIAIPAFHNNTTKYKLTERLPQAIGREFISRTRYQVIQDETQADAILRGTVSNYFSGPTIFDPATGRASGIQVFVILRIELIERATGKVLYSAPNMEVKERYEVSVEQIPYFDENQDALDRLSRQVARDVVSSILEKF